MFTNERKTITTTSREYNNNNNKSMEQFARLLEALTVEKELGIREEEQKDIWPVWGAALNHSAQR